MPRPTLAPHSGAASNPCTFHAARQKLQLSGRQHLHTRAGTPFTAEAHTPTKGNHIGAPCIWIKNNGRSIAYIYDDCWGYVTNYAGTYIDIYTTIL